MVKPPLTMGLDANPKPLPSNGSCTFYDVAASAPFSAGATRVPIASMARISFACGNDAAFI